MGKLGRQSLKKLGFYISTPYFFISSCASKDIFYDLSISLKTFFMEALDFLVISATVSHPNEQTVVELCCTDTLYQYALPGIFM